MARYGGSIENRARLAIEVVTAVGTAIGFDKTAVKFSPNGNYGDMAGSEDFHDVFSYVIENVGKVGTGSFVFDL